MGDRERPLNKRGLKDAPAMGKILQKRGVQVDAMIVSLATRAWTTAELISDELEYPREEMIQESSIYAAGVGALMHVIENIDEDVTTACLIGHNPGFEDLANKLLGGQGLSQLPEWSHLPTCAVLRLQFKNKTWGTIGEGDGELLEFFSPKNLPEDLS